ncbi:hypothetical protein ACVXG8_01115 [Escherichia coli]
MSTSPGRWLCGDGSENGQIREMYGRKIGNDRVKARRYICTCPALTAVCGNEQALIGSSVVVLCESLIDAMSFWVAGVRNDGGLRGERLHR